MSQNQIQVPIQSENINPKDFFKVEYVTYRELKEMTERIKRRMEEMGFKVRMWYVTIGRDGRLVGVVWMRNFIIEISEIQGDEIYYKMDGIDYQLEDEVVLLMICGKILVKDLGRKVERVLVKDQEETWRMHEGLLIYGLHPDGMRDVGKYILTVSYTLF